MDDTDTLDRRILDFLQRNGRAGPLEIAEAADTVATTVQKRLSAMEESGVVRGYQPRVDYEPLGYPVTALLHLSLHGGAGRPFTSRVSADGVGPPDDVAVGLGAVVECRPQARGDHTDGDVPRRRDELAVAPDERSGERCRRGRRRRRSRGRPPVSVTTPDRAREGRGETGSQGCFDARTSISVSSGSPTSSSSARSVVP